MNRLKGKIAVITGGNSGVGAATAKLFAAEGATVVITARREAALKEVADEITAAGGEVYAVSTDISKPEDPEMLMQKVMDKYGKIDILVNNAGILEQGLKPIDKFLDEDMDRIIETNEKGTMRCMRAASKRMTTGGAIVNVASVAGDTGYRCHIDNRATRRHSLRCRSHAAHCAFFIGFDNSVHIFI